MLSKSALSIGKKLAATLVVVPILTFGYVSAEAKMSPKMTMAMPDAQMKAVLDQLTMLKGKPIPKLSATEARKQPGPTDAVKALLKKQGKSTEPEVVAKVEDKTIESVPVRVYTPSGKGTFPVLVYFHGGGWVIANIDAYDSSARALANAAKCMVVSVGYREAPEYKFPAAPEDSYKVTQWIMKNAKSMNGDPKHIAVGGESAGGNLATVVSMMSRDRKAKMPIYQLLVYPVTDHDFSRPSYTENAMAKPLNKAMMSWFWNNYLKSPTDEMNPYASPMKAKSLKGLPPATIIGAEIDPLRSEGMAYSDRLKRAGIAVNYKLYKGVTHEFFGMTAVLDKSKDAIKFAATDLKKAFSK